MCVYVCAYFRALRTRIYIGNKLIYMVCVCVCVSVHMFVCSLPHALAFSHRPADPPLVDSVGPVVVDS